MPTPSLTFGFILATLCGAMLHLIFGGDARRLGLFLLTGWIGFVIGQVVGVIFEFDMFRVGTLRLPTALAGALLALIFVQALTSPRSTRRYRRPSRER